MVPFLNEAVDMELAAAVLGFELPPAMAGQVLEDQDYTVPLPGGFTALDFIRAMHMDSITAPSPNPPLFVDYKVIRGGKKVIADTKIKTRDDLRFAVFPKINDEYLAPLHRFVDHYRSTDLALCYRTRMGASGVLNSMGLDNFSFALVDDPDLPATLLDMYVEWCIELIRRTQMIGFDFVLFADDIAFSTGPMFAPEVFRQIFLPRMKKVAAQMKIPWIYHSDGNLMPVMDDLLTLGMNCLHPIEPGAMDIEQVKKDYGHRVCLAGNIDLHYTLTRGSPEEVEREVKERIEKIGKGGGYVLGSSNSLVSYIKPENLLAMRDAFLRYRAY